MNQIHPYLSFNGKCREAMQFYKECLSAELTVITIGESPIATQFPPAMQEQVLHSCLTKNGVLFMGTDMVDPGGFNQGNSMALSMNCSSEKEINELFSKLSEGGLVLEPVKRQFWGDLFGTFTDKFGVRWMLQCSIPAEAPAKEALRTSVLINASKERVWDVLLQDETYRVWTAEFHPGSYAESDWQEGSKAYFKTPEGDGLVSRVVVHKPAEIISFEHLHVLHQGQEVLDHPEAEKWKGSRETYILRSEADGTLLSIEQDLPNEYKNHFTSVWERALLKVKELAETSVVTA